MNAVASKKLAISECLRNWGPLKQKIEELIQFESEKIEELTAHAVHEADREDLNSHVLQREAFRRVLLLAQELKEDLHPDEVSSDDE